MKTLVKKSLARITKNQSGFTLIELLIVVGIIVALAAVIVPAVAQFSGRGEKGSAAAELDTVQTAVDAMMAEEVLTTVVQNEGPAGIGPAVAAISDFSTFDFNPNTPPIALLTSYMRDNPTGYQYCWDTPGNITQLWTTDGVDVISHVGADYDAGDRPYESSAAAADCIDLDGL